MKKRVFAFFLALCLSFGFLLTDCGLFPAVHAVTSDICVCGSFAHHDMLGHTSQNSVSWDSSSRWGTRTEYNSDTGKYEDKKYMSLEEYKEYSKLTRMFGGKYVCSSIN